MRATARTPLCPRALQRPVVGHHDSFLVKKVAGPQRGQELVVRVAYPPPAPSRSGPPAVVDHVAHQGQMDSERALRPLTPQPHRLTDDDPYPGALPELQQLNRPDASAHIMPSAAQPGWDRRT